MKRDRKKRQYIFICHGKDCLKHGARDLQKVLERELKSSGTRPACELVKTKCMDHCKDGPSVVIDNTWFGKASPKEICKLVKG